MEKRFEETSDYENLKNKVLDYLTARDYSEKKLLFKVLDLKKRYPKSERYKNYTPKNIGIVIARLRDLDLINEERFLKNMLDSSLNGIYGLRRVRQKMYRGLYKKELIEKVLGEFNESDVEQDLTRIVKMTRNKKRLLEQKYRGDQEKLATVRERLMGFLANKGFDYDEILKILNLL